MPSGSRIFLPCRSLGYVSNHIPFQVRYIKSRKENLIVTCVGKSFHTYGITHFGLLSVGALHPEGITAMTADTFNVYTSCQNEIYAWRRGTELKHTYRGHKKLVHLMIPFGVHLISIDESSHVNVWDIKAETVFLELTFSNETFKISSVVHPSTYINKILFGSEQGQLQLWNINTAKLIYSFKGWESGVSCLEQAPAVDVVAVGLVNGRIILHNLKYDETIMEFTQDWGIVTSITFRTDGSPIMATGSGSGHVVFWDLEQKRVASQLLSAHDGIVSGLQCLPNEPLILSSSNDNTLKLWIFDMSDGGARLLKLREGHSASPTFIRFYGTNGSNILSSGGDSTLRIFNTQTEQFNKSLGKASYNRKSSKKRGRLVEDPLKMTPITQFDCEITREKEWDNIAAIHLELPVVTTWSYDKIKMGELKLLPERFRKTKGLEVSATALSLTNCGNFVIIGYSTGHLDRFNIQSGIHREAYGSPKAHESSIRGVASDSLNQLVVSGGSDCKIKFWNFKLKTKSDTPITTLAMDEPVNFFRSHREGSLLAVALEDFDVYVVDLETQRIVRKFSGHSAHITDATFSPDSRWLITSSMDCSIRTWDVPSCQLVDEYATETPCISLSMSPTGEALVTAHVDHLGLFLWTNRTLYSKVTLKALTPSDNPPLVELPECHVDIEETDNDVEEVEDVFVSPNQIHLDLITLSGLPTSRWLNLLNLDVIKMKNKPKQPPKAQKSAPFFLPTVQSLNFQFDLSLNNNENDGSKLLIPSTLLNLSEFGKLLDKSDDFQKVVDFLKALGPSMIDFEIKNLCPEGGGSVDLMLRFLKFIEWMLKSNNDFELAQSYLSLFLKSHGVLIAGEDKLRSYLPNLQSCHNVMWNRLQEKLLYSICVVQNLKTS